MSIQEFGVTYSDIEYRLQGFTFSLADQVRVAAMITMRAAQINTLLGQIGFNVEDEPIDSTDRLYAMAAEFIILKVSAEVGRCFSHSDPSLSQQRDMEASDIADMIRRMAASASSEDFTDRDNRIGAFQGFGGSSRVAKSSHGSGFSGS